VAYNAVQSVEPSLLPAAWTCFSETSAEFHRRWSCFCIVAAFKLKLLLTFCVNYLLVWLNHVSLGVVDVSEAHAVSIFTVDVYTLTLKMKAVCTC
jgi:hypothetical protein